MLNRICPKCNKELPKSLFSSNQAKFCLPCKQVDKLQKRNAMLQRSMDRQKNKKPKKTIITPISQLKKTAQRAFNAWIRNRDKGQPCLACGKYSDDMDASHYIAQGSSGLLRYTEENVHNTCTACNRYKHGNLIEFRIGLLNKIGVGKVKYLEDHRHDVKKWQREELEDIISRYRERKI